MLTDFNGLTMQPRVVVSRLGQDLGFLEVNAMTVAAVFTYAGDKRLKH